MAWRVTQVENGMPKVVARDLTADQAQALLLATMAKHQGRQWTNEHQRDHWSGPWAGWLRDAEPVFLGAQHG